MGEEAGLAGMDLSSSSRDLKMSNSSPLSFPFSDFSSFSDFELPNTVILGSFGFSGALGRKLDKISWVKGVEVGLRSILGL